MCDNRYVVDEKQVGDLTVKVYHDDMDCGRWRETCESAEACNLLWVPDDTRRQDSGDPAPRARFSYFDPQLSEEEMESEVADWWRCGYHCDPNCRDCEERAYRNEILRDHYFYEASWIGESYGWFVGEKTDFKDRAQFEAMCKSIEAEFKHLERGEVYGYEVTDADGDVLDSCWGFIGDAKYCLEQGVDVAEAEIKDRAEVAHVVDPYASMGNGD
jgi:hypothetical protein